MFCIWFSIIDYLDFVFEVFFEVFDTMHGPEEDDAFNEVKAHQVVETYGHTLVEVCLRICLMMAIKQFNIT